MQNILVRNAPRPNKVPWQWSQPVLLKKVREQKHPLAVCNCRHTSIYIEYIYIYIYVNSLRPSDEYMSVNLSSLVQIMVCRLIGAKPLSEPMLDYCQLDPCEHISVKFNPTTTILLKNMHVKMSSAERRPSCLCLNVLTRAMKYDIEPHMLNSYIV